jgi:hypothetical protein
MIMIIEPLYWRLFKALFSVLAVAVTLLAVAKFRETHDASQRLMLVILATPGAAIVYSWVVRSIP